MSIRVYRAMTLWRCLRVLLPCFWLATSANAGKWECGERSNLPLEGRNYCAAGDFRLAEATLQKVFAELLNQHETRFGNTDDLRAAQDAFDIYRDRQCLAENRHTEDKPFYLMVVSQCKTRFTNMRIQELEQMQ